MLSLLADVLVSVVVDGRTVESSRTAVLRGGFVFAPLDPYVRRIADRIESSGSTITLVRGNASVVLALGSPIVRSGSAVDDIPIAPFVREGEVNVPLAIAARALGESVSYDARAHVVYVRVPRAPLACMTPSAGYSTPDSPVTFSPTATPAPRATVSGVPHPRRTPILVETSPS